MVFSWTSRSAVAVMVGAGLLAGDEAMGMLKLRASELKAATPTTIGVSA
jgi:hypothetical protein